MKNFFIAVFILAGIGILGWQIYEKASASNKGSRPQRRNVPVAVEIASVKKASVREIGQFTGSLYPLSEFIVAPKITGILEKILVDIGDIIRGGQLVAELDDEEYRQQVSQVTAELEVSQANIEERRNTLGNAKREFDRTVALRKKKIASESELDAAESEYKIQLAKLRVAKAQVAQKKAALEMAKVRLSYSQIRVPENNTTGHWVVGERFVDEGAMLAPNKPIASILNIGVLIAVIHVIERDYAKIQPELEAVITTDAFSGKTFTGRVLRIAPLLKEKSREARVEIEVPNDQKLLKPGMFVRVKIQFDQHDDATVVPVASLVKRDGKQGIFLVDLKSQNARFVPVTVGIVNGTEAEILKPPINGNVVTLGHHLLEDGGEILLPDEKPKAGPRQKSGRSQKDDSTQKAGKSGIKRGKIPAAGEKS